MSGSRSDFREYIRDEASLLLLLALVAIAISCAAYFGPWCCIRLVCRLAVITLVITLALMLYFLPSLIAEKRGKVNTKAILVLNLFAGWTFIGWVGALTWAFTVDWVPHVTSGNEVGVYSKSPTISDDSSPANVQGWPGCMGIGPSGRK